MVDDTTRRGVCHQLPDITVCCELFLQEFRLKIVVADGPSMRELASNTSR